MGRKRNLGYSLSELCGCRKSTLDFLTCKQREQLWTSSKWGAGRGGWEVLTLHRNVWEQVPDPGLGSAPPSPHPQLELTLTEEKMGKNLCWGRNERALSVWWLWGTQLSITHRTTRSSFKTTRKSSNSPFHLLVFPPGAQTALGLSPELPPSPPVCLQHPWVHWHRSPSPSGWGPLLGAGECAAFPRCSGFGSSI